MQWRMVFCKKEVMHMLNSDHMIFKCDSYLVNASKNPGIKFNGF